MSQFAPAVAYVLSWEDPNLLFAAIPDAPPGAHAISGINSAAWPEQYAYISSIPQADRGFAVQNFYQLNFWNSLNIGGLTSQDLANRVLDGAVNAGLKTGAVLLQDAVNMCGQIPPLAVDGKIGPLTIEAANAADPDKLLALYRQCRANRYNQIVANNPADEEYLAGWLKRAEA
jgi:lysozyme family protein